MHLKFTFWGSLIVSIFLTDGMVRGEPTSENTQLRRKDLHGDPLPPSALARIGTVRLRHGAELVRVIFSPDGKTVVSCGWPHTIRSWDTATGKQFHCFRGHERTVMSLHIDKEGKTLTSISQDFTVRIWDLSTGREIHKLATGQSGYYGICFSPDGKIMVSCGQSIRVWDAQTYRVIREFGNSAVTKYGWSQCLTFSPDGKTLLVGNEDGLIHFWDPASGKEIRHIQAHSKQKGGVRSLAFSPDGKLLASAGEYDGSLFLRNPTTGEAIRNLLDGKPRGSSWLAFSPDSKSLACSWGEDHVIHLLDVVTAKDLRQFKGHQNYIISVAFSADGQTLASADRGGVVRLWNTRTGEPRLPFPNPQTEIASLAFGANDTVLATGEFMEPMIHCWDPATGKKLRQLPGHCEWGVNRLLNMPPDGGTLLSTGLGGEIYRWDIANGKEVNHFELGEGGTPPILSPDGKILAAIVYEKGGFFYDVASGKKTGRFGNGQTAGAVFLPDGHSLVLNIINPDRRGDSCVLWDIREGKIVRTFPKPKPSDPKQGTSVKGSCITVTPDGETLLAGTDAKVIFRWDIPTGEPLPVLDGRQKSIESLAISSDGRTLASGGEDGLLCLWDMVSGQPRGLLRGHRGSVLSLAFSRDGRRLASGSQDTTALVWDLTDGIAADPPKELTAKQLDELWRDLAGEDAVKAYRSMWTLAYAPKQSVPYLQARLQPVPAADAKQLARLLRDLDSEDFTARTKARDELEKLGESAAVALREAAQKPFSVEVGRQVKGLLEKLAVEKRTPSSERIRVLRALEGLEHAATPEAGELLKRLAQGADGAQLTRQAKASLERLAQRAKRSK